MSPPDSAIARPPIVFDNSYARLPERFFARLPPTPVASPRLLRVNRQLAAEIGIDADWLGSERGISAVAGNFVPEGSEPIALAYAGHQFGHFVAQLGDGRAILLGEIIARDGVRYDVQLKGSGRTPFSRSGDGRAAVGPILREYLVSEAMAAFGIPTTRVLSAVATGEPVFREDILPGAILARIAKGHTRIGSFQYFAARNDMDALRQLADYVIDRQALDVESGANRYVSMLDAMVSKTASLVAQWQAVGFIHGVMNTDNMSLAGETIDYGPCAFMDSYHPGTVFSSIDQQGRYAYGNQPAIAHWNVAKLAEAILPLLGADENSAIQVAQASIDRFPALYETAYRHGMTAKLGLESAQDGDSELLSELLELMAQDKSDFTLVFRYLSFLKRDDGAPEDQDFHGLFQDREAISTWLRKWRKRLFVEGRGDDDRHRVMRAINPAVIPRNHNVEAALAAAESEGDLSKFDGLLAALVNPYDGRHDKSDLAAPPRPEQVVRATFCGT